MYKIIEEVENTRETVKNLCNFYYYKAQDEGDEECKLDNELTKKLHSIVSPCFDTVFDFLSTVLSADGMNFSNRSVGRIYSCDFEPQVQLQPDEKSSITLVVDGAADKINHLPENWKLDVRESSAIFKLQSTNINDVLIDLEKLIGIIC
jgi:hypothetical protein